MMEYFYRKRKDAIYPDSVFIDWSDMNTVAKFLDEHQDWSPVYDGEARLLGLQSPFSTFRLMVPLAKQEDDDCA